MDNQYVINKKDLSQLLLKKDLFVIKNEIYPF